VNEILDNGLWREKLEHRELMFYQFVRSWVRVTLESLPRMAVPWQKVPGFDILLRALLHQMRAMEVQHYPEALKECLQALLHCEYLTDVFVHVLFQQTRVNDLPNIMAVLDLLNSLFSTLALHKKRVPSNFDFRFFLTGVQRLLSHSSEKIITGTLLLFYNHF
jgi:hypothetical protein